MVTLEQDKLIFHYPDVHRRARLELSFQRTLRVPDDGRDYPLPAGLGRFPLRHVEDYADRLPAEVRRRGGVLLPLYQAEALWIHFRTRWPMAIQVGTGKICAVTGGTWTDELTRRPQQNYATAPDQPWLDGYAVEKGQVRQFVAMPLGSGVTVEEQKTGRAEWGGIQLQCFPLRREQWERERATRRRRVDMLSLEAKAAIEEPMAVCSSMGIAPGGRIQQEIYEDGRPLAHWDRRFPLRVFVHLLNSRDWCRVTGEAPPPTPITEETYRARGIPWFDHYREDRAAVEGGRGLEDIKSVEEMGGWDEAVEPHVGPIVQTGPHRRPRRVRTGEF